MSTTHPPALPTTTTESETPPLRHGERLTRDEFERRYQAMPHLKKAELLEGVVSMPSPVHAGSHAEPHSTISGWLFAYRAAIPGVRLFDNGTVRLPGQTSELQPDAMLMIAQGGGAHVSADDYIEGAPELVAEIAASSADYDLTTKRAIYERSGVQEYLVWSVAEGRIDWWERRDGEYYALPADEHGTIASRVFPGLWLDVAALLADDMAQVLATLQRGIATRSL